MHGQPFLYRNEPYVLEDVDDVLLDAAARRAEMASVK